MASPSRLTAKNRAAWKPACPSLASNVQRRFQAKLLATATENAADRRRNVVDLGRPGEDREHRQVDGVAGAADQPELEQLDPVRRPAGAVVDPPDERQCRCRCVGDRGVLGGAHS